MVAKRIRGLVLSGVLGAGIALGAAGCGGNPQYEDCEVSDQEAREADCGYWQNTSDGYFLRDGLVDGAVWTWWSWVIVGQSSFAPADWKPPHGLKPPTESSAAEKRRKAYEKARKAEQKRQEELRKQQNRAPAAGTQPRSGSGNQGIPKGNTVPKPPAPRPATRPR